MQGMKKQYWTGRVCAASRQILGKALLSSIAVLLAGVCAHAQYLAYVANSTDGTVSVIDTATNTVVATVPVGASPQSVAVAPDGAFAYVANFGSSPGTVSVINTTTNSVAATIQVGNAPDGVAIAPNGTFAYVSNIGDNTISVIDTFTNSVTATFSLPGGFCTAGAGVNPSCGIAFTQKGAYAYVAANANGQVAVINTATNTVTTTISNGAQNAGTVALSPDRSTAYVPLFYGYVSVINTATNTVTTDWSLNGGSGGISLDGLAVTPDNATVYIESEEQNRVLVVPSATGTVSASISVGGSPSGLAMTPDGAYVYVTNTNDGTVSVIQAATNTVVATVPVGNGPYGVAIATPRDYALLNGGNSFNGNQAINGEVSAANFLGNGSGLTNVNAATLGGVPAANYARLDIGNALNGNQTVNGSVTATTFYGDGSNLTNITAANANSALMAVLAGNSSMLGGQLPSYYATTGANTFTGTQTVSGGILALDNTNSGGTTGVITLGGSHFLHNTGNQNTFLGQDAGNFSLTGSGNSASGFGALSTLTSGGANTAAGTFALGSNTTGANNTAVGSQALGSSTTSTEDTAVGYEALGNSTGGQNTAVGAGALLLTTTGTENTALGDEAGWLGGNSNTTGSENTFLGFRSGPGTSTQLTNATAVGANAVVSSNNALVLGSINGQNGATSSVNVGIGTATPSQALDVVGNILIEGAGNGITFPDGSTQTTASSGSSSITGVTAGTGLTGGGTSGNVTLNLATNSCAAGNALTALPFACSPFAGLGANAFSGNQNVTGTVTATAFSGDGSALTDVNAATALTAGTANSAATAANALALGGQAPSYYATLGANTFTATQTINGGNLALPNTNSAGTAGVITLGGNPFLHDFGTFNTFIGDAAGNFSMTGQSNTGVGVSALQDNSTGINNTAMGFVALPRNTSGSNNTAEGYGALEFSTTGSNNTASGFWAGLTTNTDNANTTGSENTFVGSYSGPGVASSANLQNATAIGANAVVSASNALVLGSINGVNGAGSNVNVGIGTATPAYALDVEGGQINASGGLCIAGVCNTTWPVGGSVTSVATGAGLTGGPITGSGTISVATGGVTNAMLANPSLAVTAGSGLTGGGAVSLGGTTTLALATNTCAAGSALTALPAGACTPFAGLGANTFTATQTVGAGDLALPKTTSNASGVITLGGSPFIHNFGTDNAFVGQGAGNFTMTGGENTGIGLEALSGNTTGNGNAATGFAALGDNTTGGENTGSGDLALGLNTTGSNNTAVGFLAGVDLNGANANTTGSNNTFIGYESGPGVASSANLQNATAIGSYAVVSANNALVLGSISGVNGATASAKVGIGTPTPAYALDVEGGQVNASGGLCIAGTCRTAWGAGTGTVTSVGTGAGLTGGPITGSGTISVAPSGITNAMLANPSLTVTAGTGLTGGGSVALGGTTTLTLATHTCAAGSALTALPAGTCTTFAGLGANTFTATQTMPGLSVSGQGFFNNSGSIAPAVLGEGTTSVGVSGSSSSTAGVSGATTSTSTTTAAGLFDNAGTTNAGNILLGEYNSTTEFTVDAKGDVTGTGAAKFASYSVSGTAPTCTFSTGGGSGPACALDTGSTNSAGIIIAKTGTAPAATGTITLTFSAAFGADKPVCIYEAGDAGTGTWGPLAGIQDKTPSTASDVFTWTNFALGTIGVSESALSAGKTYYINYHCIAK